MFQPFKMPDLCARPDGKTKSLKEAYIYLRNQGLADKDIFIYAQGEFSSFKGEILDQQPLAGEMVYTDSHIVLHAAVAGICQVLPDLFTDSLSGTLAYDNDPRQGVKSLFAIFDNHFLKMMCRLDWIRDIYAGIYHSSHGADRQNLIFFDTDSLVDEGYADSHSFILSRLSRFQGTQGALKVFLESTTGLIVDISIAENQKTSIPSTSTAKLDQACKLGTNIFLGEDFEGEKPKLKITLKLTKPGDIAKAIAITEDACYFDNVLNFILPYYSDKFEISIKPEAEEMKFLNGNSYLGFSTAIACANNEKS